MNNKKTVFITGASKGIGHMTALKFANNGYNVVATMRNTNDAKELSKFDNVLVLSLDVTNIDSIKNSIKEANQRFGSIDILINNAGYGAYGIFEYSTEEDWYKQFEVNVFGVMRVTKELLPILRKSSDATIVNISSMGGLITSPGGSLYHSSKFAIEGWTEALYYDLMETNVKVKLIEPGGIKTDWGGSSLQLIGIDNNEKQYNKITNFLKLWQKSSYDEVAGTSVEKCSDEIYKFTISKTKKMRKLIGSDAKQVTFMKKTMGTPSYQKFVFKSFNSLIKKSLKNK